jgi:hypothetical protein
LVLINIRIRNNNMSQQIKEADASSVQRGAGPAGSVAIATATVNKGYGIVDQKTADVSVHGSTGTAQPATAIPVHDGVTINPYGK